MSKNYIRTSKINPCPLCDDTSGKCRSKDDGGKTFFLCMTVGNARFGEVINGFKCIKECSPNKSYSGTTWTIDNTTEWTEERKAEWERRKAEQKEQRIRQLISKQRRSLSPKERDKNYRIILEQLELHPDDKADLMRRGFTSEQIEKCGFRSVGRYQQLQIAVNPELPGVGSNGKKLIASGDGYLIPVKDINGYIVACQIRLRNPKDGNRYIWLSGDDNVLHFYPKGKEELPLAIFKNGNAVALVEGTGAKPFLLAERWKLTVIGAAGGQWLSSPETSLDALSKLNKNDFVYIFPDAGDILNPNVMLRWKGVIHQLREWGINTIVWWWGQVTKEDCDIDEEPTGKFQEFTGEDWLVFAAETAVAYQKANQQSQPENTSKTSQKTQPDSSSKSDEQESSSESNADDRLALIKEIRQAKLTWKPNLLVNQRYLTVTLPSKGLIFNKSCKDSGKTTNSKKNIENCISEGIPVLNITHRISLGRVMAENLGLTWVDEKSSTEEVLTRWLGLCVDSLHPYGKARFNWEDWTGATVIIDEIEQFLKHLFSSTTCAKKRSIILRCITRLVNHVLDTGGRIINLDADLSDLSVNYLYNLTGKRHKPYIIVNTYKHEPFPVTWFNTKSPAPMKAEIRKLLEAGKRVLVLTDSQKEKSAYGTYNLEAEFKKDFPLLSILRIDSKTLQDPTQLAYGCLANINLALKPYPLVIPSPSCNTGASIELFAHYDAVFLIGKGVLNAYDYHQFLWRLRDAKVRRYIWVKPKGICTHQGSIFPKQIIDKTLSKLKKSIAYQLGILEESIDLEKALDPIHTRFAAKFIARDNASKLDLRGHLLEILQEEGCQIEFSEVDKLERQIDSLKIKETGLLDAQLNTKSDEEYQRINQEIQEVEKELSKLLPQKFKLQGEAEQEHNKQLATKEESTEELFEQTSLASDLEDSVAESLDKAKTKTKEQDLALSKWKTGKKYGRVEVTKELVKLDSNDRNFYRKLRRHYYLTNKPEYLRVRDLKHLGSRLDPVKNLNNPISIDYPLTFNDVHLLSGEIALLQKLGVLRLLEPEQRLTESSELINELVEAIRSQSQEIRDLLGTSITEKMKPMQVVQTLLGDAIGLRLSRVSVSNGKKKSKAYIFKGIPESDPRLAIFERWVAEDEQAIAEFNESETLPDISLIVETPPSEAGDTPTGDTPGNINRSIYLGVSPDELNNKSQSRMVGGSASERPTKLICINGGLVEVYSDNLKPVENSRFTSAPVAAATEAVEVKVSPVPLELQPNSEDCVPDAVSQVDVTKVKPENLIGKAISYFSNYQNKLITLGRIKAIDSVEEVIENRILGIKRQVVSFVTTTGDYVTDKEIAKGVYQIT